MIKKCPRCSNENIKEDYKYCPICGIKIVNVQKLKEIKIKEE